MAGCSASLPRARAYVRAHSYPEHPPQPPSLAESLLNTINSLPFAIPVMLPVLSIFSLLAYQLPPRSPAAPPGIDSQGSDVPLHTAPPRLSPQAGDNRPTSWFRGLHLGPGTLRAFIILLTTGRHLTCERTSGKPS